METHILALNSANRLSAWQDLRKAGYREDTGSFCNRIRRYRRLITLKAACSLSALEQGLRVPWVGNQHLWARPWGQWTWKAVSLGQKVISELPTRVWGRRGRGYERSNANTAEKSPREKVSETGSSGELRRVQWWLVLLGLCCIVTNS